MLPLQLPSPGQPGGPPNIRPSYAVHIAGTKPQQLGTVGTEGPTWFTSSGSRLQDLLSKLYSMPAERIEFDQPGLADRRLDIALRLPAEESQSGMHQRIVLALETQLEIMIRSVARTEDVYAVSINDAKKLPSKQPSSLGGFSSAVTEFYVLPSERTLTDQHAFAQLMQQRFEDKRKQDGIALDSLHIDGAVDDLCRILETGVQRPVLDRTGYQGPIKISIRRNGLDRDQFFEELRANYGLAIKPTTADVEHLIVRAETSKHFSP